MSIPISRQVRRSLLTVLALTSATVLTLAVPAAAHAQQAAGAITPTTTDSAGRPVRSNATLIPEAEQWSGGVPMMTTVPLTPTVPPTTPPFDPAAPSATMPSRPTTETGTPQPGVIPQAQARAAQGCEDFYTPSQGRWFTLCGDILAKYKALGGPGGFMGLPTSNELWNPDGIGKRASFEGGSSIYWRPYRGAFQIGGAIGARWAATGWEAGPLGYPTTDEITNPDGVGKRNWFDGGAIYYHPTTGAWEVWGAILEKWRQEHYETGRYGYPKGPEVRIYGGYMQPFAGGDIYWGLASPNCRTKPDNPHGSFHQPGTTNMEGGVPKSPGYECNRPVKYLSFELKMMADSPNDGYKWQLVDWVGFGPYSNVTYRKANIAWNSCVQGLSAYGLSRGAVIDWDGVSYALPPEESAHTPLNCT